MHESAIRVIAEAQEYKAFRAERREDNSGYYRRECNKRHTLANGTIREYHYWRDSKTRKYHPARKTDPLWANEIVDVTNDVLEAV